MCGIVGYLAPDEVTERMEDGLASAVRILRHRGPDAEGIWHSGSGVGLGHTRLSIIDLSESGAQPMLARDAEIAIVFNGEIYNFRELRRELIAKGHLLVSNSDTEVVLAAYREWGPACVEHFIGMFAFAIWDGTQKRLSLCRDRIGVKPLFYGWDGHVLCFASELKALRELPHWSVVINPDAVGEFLQYGYISAPRTIYKQIWKLPPGCWLHISIGHEPQIAPYWSLNDVLTRDTFIHEAPELEKQLEELLASACQYRMVSDVPVGLFLSGGIDSSLVAAILKSSGLELKTFSIGFKSARHDESAAAAKVAGALGLENHSLIIDEAEAEDVLSIWPSLYDEPFGDHSGIPTYLVAKMAREHVKVALSADGGDELFCGYAGYEQEARRISARKQIPFWVRDLGVRGLNQISSLNLMDLAGSSGRTLHRAVGGGRVLDRLHKMRGYLDAPAGLDVVRPFRTFWQVGEIADLLGYSYQDPRQGNGGWTGTPMEQSTAMDLHEFLPDNVLAKVDRATMAVSLEGREPLLDHRVVEFAFRLPLALRHGRLGNKHILRSILYRHVPRELVDRPKQGFAVPIRDWMQRLIDNGAVRSSCEILKEKIGLNVPYLEGALHVYQSSDQGKNRLWLIYALGQWAQRWL